MTYYRKTLTLQMGLCQLPWRRRPKGGLPCKSHSKLPS